MGEKLNLSVDEARKLHERRGYKPYGGPKLEGARTVLVPGGSGFPPALERIPDPPAKLYCIGNVCALSEGLAVIGARKATPYGRACARKFAGMAAERGIAIISGGARGCDSEAHRAALDAGAPTVVFLGGGCDQPYPQNHAGLFQGVIDGGGAVVSEREWGFPALPFTFRARNRLIAGLAKATLIVEAGLPSGTFSTADEALAANRDVLVVPGAITSETSAGSNRLLYQGAVPVVDEETFEDALWQLFGTLKQERADPLEHVARNGPRDGVGIRGLEDDVLYWALAAEPMRMEEIMSRVAPLMGGEANPAAAVQVRLIELERAGLVGRYPDGRLGPLKV